MTLWEVNLTFFPTDLLQGTDSPQTRDLHCSGLSSLERGFVLLRERNDIVGTHAGSVALAQPTLRVVQFL